MSGIRVVATGAVSPAGWGVASFLEALSDGVMPGRVALDRQTEDGRTVSTEVLRVPKMADRSLLPKSPRLRRTSPAGKFAAAAAFEALGEERIELCRSGAMRLGVICTMMNGCVNYSNRFFGEVLADPAMASPILFPETVYNAPSSHISAMAGATAPNDTLVGDGAEFFTGLEMAAEWLERDDCDHCLLVAPEEVDWLSAEAMGYYSRGLVPSEGAAALLLTKGAEGPRLLRVPDPVSFSEEQDRGVAMSRLWADLDVEDDGSTVWSDGCCGVDRFDRSQNRDWEGPRISVRQVLGECLGAATGLQTVAAIESLRRNESQMAVITAVGGNEAVAGAVFGR